MVGYEMNPIYPIVDDVYESLYVLHLSLLKDCKCDTGREIVWQLMIVAVRVVSSSSSSSRRSSSTGSSRSTSINNSIITTIL